MVVSYAFSTTFQVGQFKLASDVYRAGKLTAQRAQAFERAH